MRIVARRQPFLLSILVISGPIAIPHATAQIICDPQLTQEIESTHDLGIGFGRGLAADRDTAVIGAPLHPSGGPGAAYVYERVGAEWVETSELVPSNGANGDEFGQSIDIDGDTIVIGARKHDGADSNTGAAYVYRRIGDQWIEEAVLEPDGLLRGDYFGDAVAIEGDLIVVGASLQGGNCNPCVGRAHVYLRSNGVWSEVAVLEPSDGNAIGIGFFGSAIDLQGDRIVIGAYSDELGIGNAGSVYVFERVGRSWVETQKLTASDAQANAHFGFSLALDGDVLAIGAEEPCCPDRPGSAYIFEREDGVWSESIKLLASDGENNDRFGSSVAVAGDAVVIGAPYPDEFLGSAYLFHRNEGGANQWGEVANLVHLIDPDPVLRFFGFSLAVSADELLVGSFSGFPERVFAFDLNCGPTLSILGSCPGRMGFAVEGAQANARVAFLYARGEGSFEIPPGNPCSGTVLGLNRTVQLADVVRADEQGVATLEVPNVPDAVCGSVYVQAVDLETCAITNVVLVD